MTPRFQYAHRGAPPEDALLAKYVSDLLVPAVTKATIDLWVATDQLQSFSYLEYPYRKTGPYEVTIVQNLIEVMAAHGHMHGTPVWEVGFRATAVGAGRPTAVDVVLENEDSTLHAKRALLEFGVGSGFKKSKIDGDLGKLAELQHHGQAVTGFKQMHFVSVTASPTAVAYANFVGTARAAVSADRGELICARRFPVYRPDGWAYVSIGSYRAA